MDNKVKKTRILSLSIIEKAIQAIEDTPDDMRDLLDVAIKYQRVDLFHYYKDVVEELKYLFERRKSDFIKINQLFITRERLHRVLNPTIYLNAYKEKRANDALYINANVGFIDEKGKVKNVVVFMGKSEITDLNLLKEKIESDTKFIEEAKNQVFKKLADKIQIPEFDIQENDARRQYHLDVVPEFNKQQQRIMKTLRKAVNNLDKHKEAKDEEREKKSIESVILLTRSLLKALPETN